MGSTISPIFLYDISKDRQVTLDDTLFEAVFEFLISDPKKNSQIFKITPKDLKL